MLQSPLFIQIITAVISFALFAFGFHFLEKQEHASGSEKIKYGILMLIMFVSTAIGAIYFFHNLITTTPFTFGKMVLACIKAIIFIIIGAEILMFFQGHIDEIEVQMGVIATTCIACSFIVPISGLINNSSYEKNVIEVEEQRYSDEKFELVPIFNDQEIEGSINIVVSPSIYYNISLEESDEDTTDVANKEVYEICYIDDGEKLYTKLDAQNTSIIPIKNGEKAYYKIKTYMSYCIDNNQDPPVECNQEYTYKYELYIPEQTNNNAEATSQGG